MMTNASPTQNVAKQLPAANGLAIVRVTIGAMFVWVFFENLGKGLYTPAGYAGLINYYIKASHSPAALEAVMGLAANHRPIAAPAPAMTRMSLAILLLIPTHNEAQAIERVLADLPSDLTTEVIVVDSNSNDGTPEIAARMGARVVQEPRRGYGRACLTGLATANSPDVVVFLDGDYSDRPSELPILLAPITEGRADITLGSRLQARRSAGARPWHQGC